MRDTRNSTPDANRHDRRHPAQCALLDDPAQQHGFPAIADLAPYTADAYMGVAPDSRPAKIAYKSSLG
ncbi:hypothetical protein, partial [Amycolatopsis sp. NPDC003676]